MSNYSPVSKSVPSADGTRIFANAIGNSSNLTLVFVHGGSSDQSVWDDIFLGTNFANDFFLIRYDLRGVGRTEKPSTPEMYTPKKYTEDFTAVLQAFGVAKAVYVGWSMGAMAIADLVAHLPEGVLQGAVCLASTPYVDGAVLGSFNPIVAQLRAGASSADATEARNAVLTSNRLLFMRSKTTPPDIIQSTAAAVAAGADFAEDNPAVSWSLRTRMLGVAMLSSGVYADLLATREQDFSKVAERGAKGFPVQVILGSDDALIDEKKLTEALKPVFKNLRLKVIEGGSHAPFIDSPEEVLETISEFVKGL